MKKASMITAACTLWALSGAVYAQEETLVEETPVEETLVEEPVLEQTESAVISAASAETLQRVYDKLSIKVEEGETSERALQAIEHAQQVSQTGAITSFDARAREPGQGNGMGVQGESSSSMGAANGAGQGGNGNGSGNGNGGGGNGNGGGGNGGGNGRG